MPAGRPPAPDPMLAIDGRRARLPQSGRPRRRLRQGCRGLPPDARLRLRLRRGRHAHAAAAGRQSEAAPVPARRGRGGDQPAGLQQSGPGGGAGAAGEARPARRASSASISAPTRTAPATAIADYAAGVRAMLGVADYLTVNISSPNTPGLRALQDKGALDELLAAVIEARGAGAAGVPEGRARSRAGRDRRHRRGRDRPADRRADRRQHHDQPAAAPIAARGRDRRPFRRAARRRSRCSGCAISARRPAARCR